MSQQPQTQYVVVVKDRPNHILHLLLTIVTCGLWLPIWFLTSLSMSFKRKFLR